MSSVHGLADVLEPSGRGGESPMTLTRPGRVDFAFADTVHTNELLDDELPPASGPMIVKDSTGHRRMNPLAFPPPAPREPREVRDPGVTSRAKSALDESVHEMKELWASTDGEDMGVVDRLRTVWSFWEWDRTDMVRAAIIGIAVFLAVATIGVSLGQ